MVFGKHPIQVGFFGSGGEFLFELKEHSIPWLASGASEPLREVSKKANCSVLGVGLYHSWPFPGTSRGSTESFFLCHTIIMVLRG